MVKTPGPLYKFFIGLWEFGGYKGNLEERIFANGRPLYYHENAIAYLQITPNISKFLFGYLVISWNGAVITNKDLLNQILFTIG